MFMVLITAQYGASRLDTVTLGLNDDDNCWTMSSIAANDENLTYYIPQDSEVPQLRTPTMKMVMMIPSPKQGVVQKS